MNKETILKTWLVSLLVTLVLGACAGTSTERSTGAYIDDKSISTQVKTALIADKDVKARNIEVETYKGVVQLSGFVQTKEERERAVMLAQKVDGVKSVKDDIQLRQ